MAECHISSTHGTCKLYFLPLAGAGRGRFLRFFLRGAFSYHVRSSDPGGISYKRKETQYQDKPNYMYNMFMYCRMYVKCVHALAHQKNTVTKVLKATNHVSDGRVHDKGRLYLIVKRSRLIRTRTLSFTLVIYKVHVSC